MADRIGYIPTFTHGLDDLANPVCGSAEVWAKDKRGATCPAATLDVRGREPSVQFAQTPPLSRSTCRLRYLQITRPDRGVPLG